MNHQSKNNQNQQKRSLAEHLAKHEAEKRKKWAGKNRDTGAQNQSSEEWISVDIGCLGFCLCLVFPSLIDSFLWTLYHKGYANSLRSFPSFLEILAVILEFLVLSAKQNLQIISPYLQIISPFIIPLFWLLIRQVSIFLAQSLILHLGFPPHWNKRIDQALGSFFGFLIIAVVWELPGPLTLGPLDDLWVRLSLTIMTLLFLIFTYLTQDFLPKRRLIRGLSS